MGRPWKWAAPLHGPMSQTKRKGGRELVEHRSSSLPANQGLSVPKRLRRPFPPAAVLTRRFSEATRKVSGTLSMFKEGWAKPCSVWWWLCVQLRSQPQAGACLEDCSTQLMQDSSTVTMTRSSLTGRSRACSDKTFSPFGTKWKGLAYVPTSEVFLGRSKACLFHDININH